MIDKDLLEILRCPVCKGVLVHERAPEALTCAACRKRYPVREGVPVLLADSASDL